ncbi:ribonuclease P protein subunit rpr2 [Anoplophora glabripennis]|uniref:ribonuclease P protein subunit rpr2 n=1 Tax=Anoplophora glabripennis TaxID=217634 RepID=UPI00087567A2|nr:ribonuclease P protein subunit rpr2 [Anoplophora glabripennis]XP_018563052.1 ribonuclease P protein subunit rpr2 [Anoplophora glabripennis]
MSKIKKCVGKEGFQRINYLYQASNLLATENASCSIASSLYSNLLVNISKKTVQRIGIDIKRTICKGCRSLLLAGITCKVRIKKKKVIWMCLECGTAKTFETVNKTYMPWSQSEESIVEILDYTPQENIQRKHMSDSH